MKPSLQLKLSQSLAMTPQLQQAIRLLQLSSLELQTEIQDALESNMMLELDEDDAEQSAEPAAAPQEGDPGLDLNEGDIAPDLPVDTAWDDLYDGFVTYSRSSGGPEYSGLESQDSAQNSLREHLLWQLNVAPCNDSDRAIGTAIIDAIDDDGYLTCSLDEIRESMASETVEWEEVETMLRRVQAMEPTGVGARGLGECLMLQLAQQPADTPWLAQSRTVITHHLQLLAAHDYAQLLRRMKLKREELQQVIGLIQSLDPRPGARIQQARTEYVVPDVYVRKDRGAWKVELNNEALPRLRINHSYLNMIRRADNSADNTSLKNHLQEARWFIKSLQSRSETLLRVASCIVERQRAFLEFGEEAMKPLVLNDIAESLGMHESTISRVTTRKYMHTPRGIFELKYFFSSHVLTEEGRACSSTAIRALIRKLIGAELPQKPLSDSKIALLLGEQGIRVARRTVAKYREAMAIPPSNERKRLG